ncbi:erythromycin esterase family protein [Microbacterium sp. Se63.02b]|uniref:erythromycin esterase family protein n=1 Tax=Microbacterium sp. Se63.02b TaxID=2709304 RepID=UPI001604AD7F|nr:erythromycin esterase family protein [Microbacterium sp. Se63.02b]QNA92604.1 erythromycin esterase family protein [Microbacterium sp. Se63.02b]
MNGDALTEWLRLDAHPLAGEDPEDVSDTALAPVLDIIGDSRVVALGESMHRTHEFPAWRRRLFRFLVENAGFSAMVIESGFPEGALVDRWVSSGTGSLRRALTEGITYHFGKCQEALDLVVWMREHNATAVAPLHFYGMDIPDSAASPLPALTTVADALDGMDPAYAEHLRRTLIAAHDFLPSDRSGLARAAPAIHSYLALDAPRRHAITAGIAALVERLRARRTDYLADGAEADTVDHMIRVAETARGADAFLSAMLDGATRTWPAANIRDLTMADTVQWILEREKRILVFGANGHVRKTSYLAPPFVTQPLATVGTHLHARLGDDYTVIGTTFGEGEVWLHSPSPDDLPGHSTPFLQELGTLRPESLDAHLAGSGLGAFLVDLRRASPAASAILDRVHGTHNGPELEPADIRRSFDAVLHVERVSPWHTWIDERGRWS